MAGCQLRKNGITTMTIAKAPGQKSNSEIMIKEKLCEKKQSIKREIYFKTGYETPRPTALINPSHLHTHFDAIAADDL